MLVPTPRPPASREPSTEAGRVLLEMLPGELLWDAPDGPMLLNVREAVLLIESGAAEARAAGEPTSEYVAYPNDPGKQEAWQHGREYGMGEITSALAQDAIEAEARATPPSLDVPSVETIIRIIDLSMEVEGPGQHDAAKQIRAALRTSNGPPHADHQPGHPHRNGRGPLVPDVPRG